MVWKLIRENSMRNMFWLTKRCTCTSYKLTDISINTSCCKKHHLLGIQAGPVAVGLGIGL